MIDIALAVTAESLSPRARFVLIWSRMVLQKPCNPRSVRAIPVLQETPICSDHPAGRGEQNGDGLRERGPIFWPFLRSPVRAPTIKAVRGTVAIKGIFDN